jgi:hypothetical protein
MAVATKQVMTPIGIVDLLKLRGFTTDKPTKLVRHQDKRYDVNDLLRRGWLDFYQATQSKPVFRRCEQIVVFVGAGKTSARFIGVYNVLNERSGKPRIRPPDGFPEVFGGYQFFYDLQAVSGFEDLQDRVIVEWGNTISWHQWLKNRNGLNNKEVLELLAGARTVPLFRDYLEFTLTHAELKELHKNEDANREWRSPLSAVAGVYLVLATTTGHQYVGSAYGAKGIWGRWSAYAKNGHGGNKHLKRLVAKGGAYPDAFSYSVLQVLPKTFAAKEVVGREQLYKEKLGTRATGLNS